MIVGLSARLYRKEAACSIGKAASFLQDVCKTQVYYFSFDCRAAGGVTVT